MRSRTGAIGLLWMSAMLGSSAGCGGTEEAAVPGQEAAYPGQMIAGAGVSASAGSTGSSTPVVADGADGAAAGGMAPVTPTASTGTAGSSMALGAASSGGGPVAEEAQATDSGWCDVQEILNTQCTKCHGTQVAFGAPMPLTSHEDLLATSPISGKVNYEIALERIQDSSRPMPPAPNPHLSDAQVAAFQAWVDGGVQDDPSCNVAPGTGGMSAGGDPDCIDCGDYTCDEGTPLQLLAHGAPTPGDETPYDASQVGGALTLNDPNYYQCFYFKVPWNETQQSVGFKPIIDNSRVLHHWLLYASENAPADITDGGMRGDCQLQSDPNRVLLAGWAPGTPGQNLPENVGQDLPVGARPFITLEVHYYNNTPGQPAPDRSGVELCLVDEPRENEATQHWLGTEKINVAAGGRGETSDTCTPNLGPNETSTIISVTPHMHKIGAHSKMEVLRANGMTEVILDEPFDFDNQTTHRLPEPVVINAGDRLRTTCTFQNSTSGAVVWGEGSDEEMCYLFTTAYPVGSLHNGKTGCYGPFCGPGGKTRCIDNEALGDIAGGL